MASPQTAHRSWFKAKNPTNIWAGFEGERREVRVHRLQHACCSVKGNNNGTPGITSLPNPGLQPRDLLYLIDKTVRSVPATDALGWILADIQYLRRSLLLMYAHNYVRRRRRRECIITLCLLLLWKSPHIVKLPGTSRKDWNPAQHTFNHLRASHIWITSAGLSWIELVAPCSFWGRNHWAIF